MTHSLGIAAVQQFQDHHQWEVLTMHKEHHLIVLKAHSQPKCANAHGLCRQVFYSKCVFCPRNLQFKLQGWKEATTNLRAEEQVAVKGT